MPGQVAGDGAFSGAGRAVDGDNDLRGAVRSSSALFVRVIYFVHPRFFDRRLEEAVKP